MRYHIQNNSIYLDNGFNTGNYESLRNKIEFTDKDGKTQNEETGAYYCLSGSPYRITVNSVNSSAMTITDAMGHTHNVVTSGGLYNLQAQEYWIKGSNVENTSSVVVHAIDGPLLFDADQFTYVPKEIIADNVKQRR